MCKQSYLSKQSHACPRYRNSRQPQGIAPTTFDRAGLQTARELTEGLQLMKFKDKSPRKRRLLMTEF